MRCQLVYSVVIFSHRFLDICSINFKTFAFLAVYWPFWTSLYSTDIKVFLNRYSTMLNNVFNKKSMSGDFLVVLWCRVTYCDTFICVFGWLPCETKIPVISLFCLILQAKTSTIWPIMQIKGNLVGHLALQKTFRISIHCV